MTCTRTLPALDEPPALAAERHETRRRQARAADPSVSAWVSANAGTGKTHVLTTRVLRLLIAGTPPERLLCLTFTKAAAAEMSNRVFERLAGWVTIDDEQLAVSLSGLLGRRPEGDEIGRARDLFTRSLETPGGLKVQTIHAFCERLLQRFPLEASVPPGFTVLDEEMKAALIREATGHVLEAATSQPDGELGRALSTAVRYATDDGFDRILIEAMAKRDWLEEASRLEHGRTRGLDAAARCFREHFGVDARETPDAIEAARAAVLSPAMLARARDVLHGGTKTDLERASELSDVLVARGDRARASALVPFFLSEKGTPRASLMTLRLAREHDGLAASLKAAQSEFVALTDKLGRLAVAEATDAVHRLAFAAMQRYHNLKAGRAALDFDDLIRTTANLLGASDAAEWVLYKLDGGLDHILVDEAQDTSPIQWQVVKALAEEFYAGADGGAARTVFAVGDEKQSIYGFQGAAPKKFADTGDHFEALTRGSGHAFERVPLTLSFRTVSPILDAVDRIFADPKRAQSLTSLGEGPRHVASRFGMAGLVELWDPEVADKSEPAPAWRPLEEVAQSAPASRLADRIAENIGAWVGSGEMLASEGRPIAWGDILVLVRRRRPFADLMVSALKKRGIPVAGADRLRLTDQLAVLDLMALADVLLLPEDDLALAAVLKSPLFGLDDNDLIALAPGRRGSLWSALLAAAREQPRFQPVADQLKRWRSRADLVPPYEFLVEVLVHDGMRERLLARLGPEAADPIDELMALALDYDDAAPPSLQGFLGWLRASDREIKRDMEHGRNEVRVMTVHGSKGLEAPIVILPDTCAGASAGRPGGLLALADLNVPRIAAEPFIWPVKGTKDVEAVRGAREAVRARDAEEHNRLLYVALTRARDRLYVAGFETTRGRERGCWYEAIETGLAGVLTETTDAAGRRIRHYAAPQIVPPVAKADVAAAVVKPEAPPEWARRKAPREPGLAIPLVPSRLAPLETDSEGDPIEAPRPAPRPDEPPSPSPARLAEGNRFLRGTLTHALLQHLPGIAAGERRAAATAFVTARGAALSARTRASIVDETLAVLAQPDFGRVFGAASRAEVPLVAEIDSPSGRGQTIRLTGQIDRLVVTDHEVLIVDFKTNRPPPTDAALVPDAYVLQLAAYRLAISQIFPRRRVRAALLWTDGPRLMELTPERLDEAANRLFQLEARNLDA
jgi:ATP-dependent helicase/nuclease subunit A